MSTKQPGIEKSLQDNSKKGTIVSNDINIGMPLEGVTGPLMATVRSQTELLDLYWDNDVISADMPVTMLNALKLLQFTPIIVSRAVSTKVLPARSDKKGSNGSSVLYVDTEYLPYEKVFKFNFQQNTKVYDYVFADFKYTTYAEVLATESGDTVSTNNLNKATSVTAIQVEGTENSSKVIRFVAYYGDSDEAAKPAIEFDSVTANETRWIRVSSKKDVNVNTIFNNIQNEIAKLNLESDSEKYVPLSSLSIADATISFCGGINWQFLGISDSDHKDEYLDNYSKNESKNDFSVLCGIGDSESVMLGSDKYMYLGGVSYYIEGGSSNVPFPGVLNPFDVYSGVSIATSGSKVTAINVAYSGTELNLNNFMIYSIDAQIALANTVPMFADNGISVSFYVYKGYADQVEVLGLEEGIDYTKTISDVEGSSIYSLVTLSAVQLGKKISNCAIILPYTIDGSDGGNIAITVGTPVGLDAVINSNNLGTTDFVIKCNDINSVNKLLLRVAELLNRYNDTYTNKLIDYVNNKAVGYNKQLVIDDAATDLPGVGVTYGRNLIYYANSSLSDFTTNIVNEMVDVVNYLGVGLYVYPLVDVFSGDVYTYAIESSQSQIESSTYSNAWIVIKRTVGEESSEDYQEMNYIFYNGKWKYGTLPGYQYIQISSGKLTYNQFMNFLTDAIKIKFACTSLATGFALYEHDINVNFKIIDKLADGDYSIEMQGNDAAVEYLPKKSFVTDYTDLINKSAIIVCSKYVNSTNILKFSLEVSEDDPEIYHLTLTRKGIDTEYDISFIPNKVDGYGRAIFYTYVNDEDNGSRDFHLTRVNEDIYNVPADSVNSPLFGSEVFISEATIGDFKTAIDRYKEKLGIYYNYLFDGGYANTVIGNYLYNTGREIWARALLTAPDIKDPDQLVSYRQALGIDHYEASLYGPLVPDTTLGEFVLNLSQVTQYLERKLLNKSSGQEFAPLFYFTNGRLALAPKYRYDDDLVRNKLLSNQVNISVWNRARQVSYLLLDLTLQKADSSLSEGNNVDMINIMTHVADYIAESYIGRYNDQPTRKEFVDEVDTAYQNRLITNQKYKIDDYKLICDTSNNTDEIIENRYLVLDVLSKFRDGIRYIKVIHRVYKLSQDLNAVS